ncbi:ATP-grasp domain-containing protein [Myxococcota bacterium]|nr:ATP-grasp domain-containing protein [Myxococcota bacterium]
MHIIFLAPHFPSNQRQFVRALAGIGARVSGIGETPLSHLDHEIKGWLYGYEQVPSVGNEEAVYQAVRRIQDRGPWVDRFEATIESHMLLAARVRERAKIPGISSETINLCRDKFQMKQFLRARGVPCARNAAVNNAEKAWLFVKETGYPVILKPRDGAGAHATYRIDNAEQLKQALAETGLSNSQNAFFTMEEFIEGHEGFYDTLTCNGQVIFDGICHYYPNVLEAMRTRWISPQIVLTNRIDSPGYQPLRQFGERVIDLFQLGTTATHMEWFVGDKGLTFSEIGARPPGCRLWDLYNYANDFDLYTEWARALMFGQASPQPSRRFSAGLISLRPSQDGHVAGYSGREEMFAKYNPWILAAHFPPEGSATSPVGAGYLAHAWVWVRHPDYDACRAMLDDIGQTVKMWAH